MSECDQEGREHVMAHDQLQQWVSSPTQKQAARLVQEAFTALFRVSAGLSDGVEAADAAKLTADMDKVRTTLQNWCGTGASAQESSVRAALVLSGLDQWGLGYAQVFELQALPAVSQVLADLRTSLDEQQEAKCLQHFANLQQHEWDAIDFKIDLRRGLHLSLWYAAIACEQLEEAERIVLGLSALMAALLKLMPENGWRLVADALAYIQIACLKEGLAAQGVAQQATQQLFTNLSVMMPADRYDMVMRLASEAVLGWDNARRSH